MVNAKKVEILKILEAEVKPALGCTEPIAVSLAVAKAAEAVVAKGESVERVAVEVSANILKNGMGVGVPGTGMVGLHIAAALGVTCGKLSYGLEVLKEVNESSIAKAKEMLKEERVEIKLAESDQKLYISASVTTLNHSATAIIEEDHDNITTLIVDGELQIEESEKGEEMSRQVEGEESWPLTVLTIYQFIKEVPFSDIEFILESVTLNRALAEEGLTSEWGLKVGKTIKESSHNSVFGDGLISYAMALTAAASDARMAGSTLPAMSNSGSGNQGITVTLPVIAYAEKLGVTQEKLARALTLSHLVAIHIKHYLGRLSALCGCVIASTGAACGIVYLKGGSVDQIGHAIKNMIGNITGMVCDGAKVGCALKVASGVSSAVQAATLALDNISISENDGIIERDLEKTIKNLGLIGSDGMVETDKMILDIMVGK